MFATEIDPAAIYCVTSSTMLLCGRQRVRRGAPVLGVDLPRALAERGQQHGQARVVEVHACAGVDLGGFAQPGAAVAVLARMGDDSDAALAVAWGPEIPGFAHLLAGGHAAA